MYEQRLIKGMAKELAVPVPFLSVGELLIFFLALKTRLKKHNPAQEREKGTWLPTLAIFKLNFCRYYN